MRLKELVSAVFLFAFLEVGGVRAANGIQSEITAIDSFYFHRDQGRNLNLSLDQIKAALSKNPKTPALLWREGRDYIRMGEKADQSKKKLYFFEKAKKALEESLQIESHQPDAHFWLGVALGRIGQTRGILRSLFLLEPVRRQMDEALSLDHHYEPAIHAQGEVYLDLPGFVGGSLDKAVLKFKEARAIDPNDLVNLLSLGEAYQKRGEKEKALNVLKAALEVKTPSDNGEYQDDRKDIQKLIKEISKGS